MSESKRFTDDDLFLRWNEPGHSDLYPGIECRECGAAVINTERHVEWHNRDSHDALAKEVEREIAALVAGFATAQAAEDERKRGGK